MISFSLSMALRCGLTLPLALPLAARVHDGHLPAPAKAAKKPALALGVAFASDEQAESDDDGRHFTLRRLARTEADSDYPVLLRKGAQLFVLWNTTEKRHVEAL